VGDDSVDDLRSSIKEMILVCDELWAWPDNAEEPGLVVPVEGEEFMFTVDTGDQGVYELEFMRDESSEYTKCHVNNEALAMDVIGEKIKE